MAYFVQAGELFSIRTSKFWSILVEPNFFVANLITFWCTFYRPTWYSGVSKWTNIRYGCQARKPYWSDLSWKILQASFAVQSFDLGPSLWFIRSCYFTRTPNYHKGSIIAKITLRFAIWEQELSSKSIQKRPLPQVIFNSYTRKPIEKAHPEEISFQFHFLQQ